MTIILMSGSMRLIYCAVKYLGSLSPLFSGSSVQYDMSHSVEALASPVTNKLFIYSICNQYKFRLEERHTGVGERRMRLTISMWKTKGDVHHSRTHSGT